MLPSIQNCSGVQLQVTALWCLLYVNSHVTLLKACKDTARLIDKTKSVFQQITSWTNQAHTSAWVSQTHESEPGQRTQLSSVSMNRKVDVYILSHASSELMCAIVQELIQPWISHVTSKKSMCPQFLHKFITCICYCPDSAPQWSAHTLHTYCNISASFILWQHSSQEDSMTSNLTTSAQKLDNINTAHDFVPSYISFMLMLLIHCLFSLQCNSPCFPSGIVNNNLHMMVMCMLFSWLTHELSSIKRRISLMPVNNLQNSQVILFIIELLY